MTEALSAALARELGEIATSEFGKKVVTYVEEWQERSDPHWVDLAVASVVEAGHEMPPSLQKIAGLAARLRIEMPGAEYDGYLIHLAESALDQEPSQRGPIDAVWRAAADGSLPDADAAQWAQIIGKRVVEQVINYKGPTEGRAKAAVDALGLRGRVDELYDARRALEVVRDFLPIAQPSDPPLSWRRRLLKALAPHFEGVNERDALKRIERLEKSLKKPR